MQRQTKQSLIETIKKNMWTLIGSCFLIPMMYQIATIPVQQRDLFKPHINYLIKEEVSH
ncbi:hypothetical protein NUACC26_078080 [Scytonema sp. NUACC26]